MSPARESSDAAVKIVGGIIEGRVDLLAGGKAVLRGREQIGGRLQREKVLANRRRENNT